jgi:hypothetical protein
MVKLTMICGMQHRCKLCKRENVVDDYKERDTNHLFRTDASDTAEYSQISSITIIILLRTE